jgi:hypothetical protein
MAKLTPDQQIDRRLNNVTAVFTIHLQLKRKLRICGGTAILRSRRHVASLECKDFAGKMAHFRSQGALVLQRSTNLIE